MALLFFSTNTSWNISLLRHQQPTGSLVPILACSAHGNATKWRGLYDYRFPHPRACLKPADPHDKLVYDLLIAFCIFSFFMIDKRPKGAVKTDVHNFWFLEIFNVFKCCETKNCRETVPPAPS